VAGLLGVMCEYKMAYVGEKRMLGKRWEAYHIAGSFGGVKIYELLKTSSEKDFCGSKFSYCRINIIG